MPDNTTRARGHGKQNDVLFAIVFVMMSGAGRVFAHPAAANPPLFNPVDCVTVVDKATQGYLDISYVNRADDVAFEIGDIPLDDAKTHQFFAFAGNVVPNGLEYRLFPFDEPSLARAINLPLWITTHDVVRAARANSAATGVEFSDSDVPPESVLENDVALMGRWFRITADDERRPIREAVAQRPVRWMLEDIAPGAYTVAGYVFSPPYNDWAMRSGVVKVKDGATDVAAGVLDAIKESVMSYEGRRLSGCVDAPEGTKLDAYYHLEEAADSDWQPWLNDAEAQSGRLDLCFHPDDPTLSGSVRLRIDLTTPDGHVTSLRSNDTLTFLQGRGACAETDTKCCDFPGGGAPVGAEAEAGEGLAQDAGAAADGGATLPPAPVASSNGGCTIGGVAESRRAPWQAWLAAALLALRIRSRRIRFTTPTRYFKT